jgi:hypothetical protein
MSEENEDEDEEVDASLVVYKECCNPSQTNPNG